MNTSGEFKIRTLPRKGEARRPRSPRAREMLNSRPIWGPLALIAAAFVIGGLTIDLSPKKRTVSHALSSQANYQDPMIGRLEAYARDVKFKQDLLQQRSQLENRETHSDEVIDPTVTAPEGNRSYGVNLDSENTADQLYQTLNDRPTLNTDALPEARINARLEKNKWINQLDRQERVQFVRNFIKSAYDRGYEVELDQNLVVVGVKPILNRRISLEQVIDRVSNQNQ